MVKIIDGCNFKDYIVVKSLDTGASSVKKYIITKSGIKYLLRLYNVKFMKSRYETFNNMKFLLKRGINVPNVYEYGELPNSKYGYAIIQWIDGIPLNNKLLTEKENFTYGKLAGSELLKFHDVSMSSDVDIYKKYYNSLYKKINKIANLNIHFNTKEMENFISSHISLLKNQKCSIIHGDFHPGNIVISNDRLYFIDLDVCKKDLPWSDLTTNSCNMDYPLFYTSVIYEYFKGNIPNEFWIIYNLYGCLYCLDYLLYCVRMNNKTVNDGIEKINEFLKFTNNLSLLEPEWFNKKN